MKLKICLLATNALPQSEEEQLQQITTLPFGEAERSRLLSIRNPHARRQSLGARWALWELLQENKPLATIPLLYTPSGKPYFADASLPISVSRTLKI